jgi:hypothetical protein
MAQRTDTIVLFGYHAHEPDFPPALARLSPPHREVIDKLPKIIFNVQEDPSAQSFCSMVILGMSDREDTAGLTPEQRRDSESAVSFARAMSFDQWLLQNVNDLFQAMGRPLALAWEDFDRVFVHSTGIGASQLSFKTLQNETERRHNRRLEIIIHTVQMGIIQDADPKV